MHTVSTTPGFSVFYESVAVVGWWEAGPAAVKR